jgi:hypothetical protein
VILEERGGRERKRVKERERKERGMITSIFLF